MIIPKGLVLELGVFNVFNVTWLNKRRISLLEKKPSLVFYFITLELFFRFPEAPASWCRPRACSHRPFQPSLLVYLHPTYKNTFYQGLHIGHTGLRHRWAIFTILSVLHSGPSSLTLNPAAASLQKLLLLMHLHSLGTPLGGDPGSPGTLLMAFSAFTVAHFRSFSPPTDLQKTLPSREPPTSMLA